MTNRKSILPDNFGVIKRFGESDTCAKQKVELVETSKLLHLQIDIDIVFVCRHDHHNIPEYLTVKYQQ
jgi:hypothetical protein